MTATYERLDAINREDNIEAYDALLANGIKPVESDAADIPYWRSVAESTNTRIWAEKASDKSLYADMQALLAEYRADKADMAAADATTADTAAAE